MSPPLKRRRKNRRGSALIVTLVMVVLMTAVVASALIYSGQDGRNTGKLIHNQSLQDLTQATLQYGRSFFTQSYGSWNTYLTYFETPVCAPPPASQQGCNTVSQVQQAHPELFPTLASGTQYICYVYARDDVDELPPAVNNPGQDNNLRIFVGAVCYQNFGTNPTNKVPLQSELIAPMEYNPTQAQCQSQFSGGTQGLNNCGVASGYR